MTIASSAGCASTPRFLASTDDYAAYRRIRLASTMADRLRLVEDYLTTRPDGAFAHEVRDMWQVEEPQFFTQAQASREGTLEYLAALPHGPHAEAAGSLLVAWDTHLEEGEGASLLREARRTEAQLEGASIQRQQVTDAIFDGLRALADPRVYGAKLEDAPRPLRRFLTGAEGPTWGRMPAQTTRDLFFVVPSHLERQSRVATLTLALRVTPADGLVKAGRVAGPDLFVHWLEADTLAALDPTDPHDRARGGRHAKERLEGFFEALLPKERCAVTSEPGASLLVRQCDGWTLSVTMGRPGEDDAVTLVRGEARSW